MNRLFLAVALALSLSTVAFTKDFTFTGCTADEQAVSLTVDVNDALAAQHPAVEHIAVAFSEAAKLLSAEELQSEIGFYAFIGGLDEQDAQAIDAILGPPTVTGICKN